MSETSPPPPEPNRDRDVPGSRVLMFLGFGCFLLIFTSEDGRELFPSIFEEIAGGWMPRGEEALIVSSLLTLPVIVLGAPFLFRWLERSRLLTNFLRVWTGILAACYGYFLVAYGDNVPELLVPLTLAPILTFIGLCLIRHPKPAPPQ